MNTNQAQGVDLNSWPAAASLYTHLAARPIELQNTWGAVLCSDRAPTIIDMDGRMVDKIRCYSDAHRRVLAAILSLIHNCYNIYFNTGAVIRGNHPSFPLSMRSDKRFVAKKQHHTSQRSRWTNIFFMHRSSSSESVAMAPRTQQCGA